MGRGWGWVSGVGFWGLGVQEEYRHCRTEETQPKATNDLSDGMLSQDHAAAAHQTGNDENQAEPPDGIEVQILGKTEQGSRYTTDSSRMGRHLPPDISHGTGYLYHQSCHHDGRHEVRHVAELHEIDTSEIADDGDDVRYHATLAQAQLYEVPSLKAPVEMNHHRRQQDGKEVDENEHLQLVNQGEDAQIAEQEK